jgi:hypothetical protein
MQKIISNSPSLPSQVSTRPADGDMSGNVSHDDVSGIVFLGGEWQGPSR